MSNLGSLFDLLALFFLFLTFLVAQVDPLILKQSSQIDLKFMHL